MMNVLNLNGCRTLTRLKKSMPVSNFQTTAVTVDKSAYEIVRIALTKLLLAFSLSSNSQITVGLVGLTQSIDLVLYDMASAYHQLRPTSKTDDTSTSIASKIEDQHSDCHGLVVIVTNDYKNSQHSLPSTHKDGEAMEIAFRRLDFVTYWVKNVSSQQLKNLVDQITNVQHHKFNDFRAIAFIFSGHGGEADTLEMQEPCDQNCPVASISLHDDIIDTLINHRNLVGIPKLFFIDACRGAGDASSVSKSLQLSKADSKKLHSLEGNYFLAYSTIPKNKSFLHHDFGSIWMQKIAQQLKQSVDSIQNIVANTTKVIWDDYNPHDNNVQQPQSTDTLHGALYLRPTSPYSPHNKAFRKYKLSDLDLPQSIPLVIPPGYQYDSSTYSLKKKKDFEKASLQNEEFVLNDQALEVLNSIEKPVAVLSICGPYRSGKSYFLSRFLGMKEAFKLGHTTSACTRGIWLSTTALICEQFVLIFLDSEGTDAVGDGQTSDQISTSILTLTNLLTTFLIYNSKGVPKKEDLINMSYFTELSGSIIVQDSRFQNETERLQQQLPHFCWLLRDVELADGECLSSYVRNEVLHDESENTKHKLLTLYPDLECLTLPRPGCKPKETSDESKLAKRFVESFKAIATHILEKMTVKKGYTLNPITGASLVCLARQYVTALNKPDATPNLELCWMEAMKQHLLESTEILAQLYVEEMNQEFNGVYPVEVDTTTDTTSSSLMEFHQQVLQRGISALKSKAEELLAIKQERLAENDIYRAAEEKLHSRIVVLEQKTGRVVGGELLQFIEKNRKASYEECNKLFSSLCSNYIPLNRDDIKKKYYANAIGPEKDQVFSARIDDIPGPPCNLQVTKVTHSQAKLYWDKPKLSQTKLEYEVRTSKSTVSSSHDIQPEETANCSITLDRLTPVTDYQVLVHAVNGRLLGEGIQTTFRTEPGPPNKPDITSISISKSSLLELKIHYKMPTEADANGSNITNMIVKYREISTSEEFTVHNVSIEDISNEFIPVQVDDITTPRAPYCFQVHFANRYGESIPEYHTFDTMNMMPGPPQNLKVTGIGHERIKLRWDPPRINPGTVCRYIIEMKKFEDTFKTIDERETRKSLSAVAKNLDSDAKYNFKVKAVNRNNEGQYTGELEDWIVTKYHPAIRATLVAGAAVGGTVATPFVASGGIPAAGVVLAKKGIEKGDAKQVAAGVTGVITAPLTAIAGFAAGAIGAPVGGGVFAKKAYDKLDSDSDLADSDDESDKSYRRRARSKDN